MELLCAVDIRDGTAVRLRQGDFARSDSFGDPVALARRFVDDGARWLHVVDLDAARSGVPANRAAVLEIAGLASASGVRVQAGGGVRQPDDVAELLEGGVSRVVLGTTAARRPDLVAELATAHPGRIVVGLDHRGGTVAVSGWESVADLGVGAMLDRYADVPVGALVVTAIERDGVLSGPDLAGLAAVLDVTGHEVVASGGVGSVADLMALSDLAAPRTGRRLWGAVVGRALVDGTVDVKEALAACASSD